MKKYLILIITLFSVAIVHAQKHDAENLIKIDLSLLNKIRVGYEFCQSEKFTFGATGNLYYGDIPGIKLEPFARFYPGVEAPDGLYFQGRFLYGIFAKKWNYYENGSVGMGVAVQKNTVYSPGAGVDVGYQWVSGRKNNIVVDASMGFQFMKDINHSIIINGVTYRTSNIGFITAGPGAIFNPHISIGYLF